MSLAPSWRKLLGYTLSGCTTALVGMSTLQAQPKSLYDNRDLEIVYLEDQPSRLEVKVKEVRLETNRTVSEVKAKLQSWVDTWIQLENQVESTILNLVPKNEKFLPNALYVGVVALSGTVLARNRNFVLRLLAPLTLGVSSSYYFLPGTTVNTYHLLNHTVKQNEELLRNPVTLAQQKFSSLAIPNTITTSPASYQSPELEDVIGKTSSALERTVAEVQSLYTTRGDPGVRPVIENQSKEDSQ